MMISSIARFKQKQLTVRLISATSFLVLFSPTIFLKTTANTTTTTNASKHHDAQLKFLNSHPSNESNGLLLSAWHLKKDAPLLPATNTAQRIESIQATASSSPSSSSVPTVAPLLLLSTTTNNNSASSSNFNSNKSPDSVIDDNLNLGELLLDRLSNFFSLQSSYLPFVNNDKHQQQQQQQHDNNNASDFSTPTTPTTTQQPTTQQHNQNELLHYDIESLVAKQLANPILSGSRLKTNHFFRVADKVFSRVSLPTVYKQPLLLVKPQHAFCAPHLGCFEEVANVFPSLLKKVNVSTVFTIYSSAMNNAAIATKNRSSKTLRSFNLRPAKRIVYEPTMHFELLDASASEQQVQLELKRQRQLQLEQNAARILNVARAQRLRAKKQHANSKPTTNYVNEQANNHASSEHSNRRVAAATNSVAAVKPSLQQQHQQLQTTKPKSTNNWQRATAASSPLVSTASTQASQEYPFDLSLLEASGFDSTLPTRIIIGGYFAKEDESWVEELIKSWILLQPNSNIIKISWADANRGLYHTAAYNARIVARQTTLFLYYLDKLFGIDLRKFHIVGHSLGAHIAGYVGHDINTDLNDNTFLDSASLNHNARHNRPTRSCNSNNNGITNGDCELQVNTNNEIVYETHRQAKLARITGLDPAGPMFVELNASMRLDPSDAAYVDVVHTNTGPMFRGALGLTAPCGHVDYYPNGNTQPGCYFSSVTKSIMDPVERVACNHRRSYRYFIEVIRLTTAEMYNKAVLDEADAEHCRNSIELGHSCEHDRFEYALQSRLPQAFLFETKDTDDELNHLNQPPEPSNRMSGVNLTRSTLHSSHTTDGLGIFKKAVEFHSFKPIRIPSSSNSLLFYFKTRSESPFFMSKQHALTIRTVDPIVRRKISISIKLDDTEIIEADLDEINHSRTLVFVAQDPRLGLPSLFNSDSQKRVPPQLSIMWRYRTFNLLLSPQANELNLASIELRLLDKSSALNNNNHQIIVKYNTILSPSSFLAATSSPPPPLLPPTSLSHNTELSKVLQSQQTNKLSRQSIIATQTSLNSMKLIKNQWYRFSGMIETQASIYNY